jgi:mono/diheme cytochrome c family protein
MRYWNMRWKWFLAGMIVFPIAAALCAAVYLKSSPDPIGARTPPGPLETAIALGARNYAIPASAALLSNPVPDSPSVQTEARAHWADHCASCHANDGSGDTPLGRRLYPPAPDMRLPRTQSMSDGQLFYIIEKGVRLTGMPAWGSPGSDPNDSWKLVRFIRRLPRLTPAEVAEMESLNPKTPDELKEEQDEKDFLNGGDLHEDHSAHHHH